MDRCRILTARGPLKARHRVEAQPASKLSSPVAFKESCSVALNRITTAASCLLGRKPSWWGRGFVVTCVLLRF